MMSWLGEWLQEIVIIILIASLIELILPSQSMQRYVKVVISLFILLTLLSPIVALLKSEFDFGKLLQEQSGAQTDGATLQQILQDGESIRIKQEQQALQLFQEQAGEVLREGIESNFPVAVDEVRFDLSQGNHEPVVERIRLTVAYIEFGQEQSKGNAKSTLVEPVKPVSIDVQLESQSADEAAQVPQEKHSELRTAIGKWIQEQWGISLQHIQVQIVTNSTTS